MIHVCTEDLKSVPLDDLPEDLTLIYTKVGGWELWQATTQIDDVGRVVNQQIAGTDHENWLAITWVSNT